MSNIQKNSEPKLSVVLASQNAVGSAADCLVKIKDQCRRLKGQVEIIVVDNSADGTENVIAELSGSVKLVRADINKLIPELWGIGISRSAGEIVALSTTHFVPAENWIEEILKAHVADNYSGIGGAIENDENSGLVSWAIYFCRYSRYMPPFEQETVEDFAADNASYKRAELTRVGSNFDEEGFWEAFVHRKMRKKKMSLALTPEIIVFHRQSFTFWAFMRQRYAHGKQFAAARGETLSGFKRIALGMLSPLIPFIYLYRITRRVIYRKRNTGKYILSLPILFLFLIGWSVGEMTGYLWKTK